MIGRLTSLGLPAAALALGGCADLASSGYSLDHAPANYDGLRRETDACKVKGGELRLRRGYAGQDLSDYDCIIGKAR